ncbi:MAG: hypothetical protein A3H98_04960 [Bacteroidetes bacterium RIFCSPLOWO2_02_FULL_36_8]|nr:MAG: hypothetical protein A3H98_04960 [Bacteroidetes bacterium RIFCSPLOWO2_02_FULL_36_8]OFY71836.1 MAG: hypothetical protein A3G23_14580 [Bacteroidetes bacterium RIFCSPLOWO2_12_FULL_37_12]
MNNKKIAILQSSYIPWKGHFDLMASVDEFILYDDVQYTVLDWRNRNKIKIPNGLQWLTIPVKHKGNPLQQKINEVEVLNNNWRIKHWKSIQQNYCKSPFFNLYKDELKEIYLGSSEKFLSKINFMFISWICTKLSIKTVFSWSSDYNCTGNRVERLVNFCKATGATHYISGPAAKSYLDVSLFENEGITVEFLKVDNYPEYPQLHGNFEHKVTVLDLLFNTGTRAREFMIT